MDMDAAAHGQRLRPEASRAPPDDPELYGSHPGRSRPVGMSPCKSRSRDGAV